MTWKLQLKKPSISATKWKWKQFHPASQISFMITSLEKPPGSRTQPFNATELNPFKFFVGMVRLDTDLLSCSSSSWLVCDCLFRLSGISLDAASVLDPLHADECFLKARWSCLVWSLVMEAALH